MSLIRKYLNPQNDVAFKRIFGTEKNKDILIAMLNSILKNQLHTPITQVQFLSPVQEPEVLAKKQSIVDVLCRDKDGCQYVIEMQIAHAKGFEERAQYYASKAFTSQLNEGEEYYNLKKVIFLAFCNFPIFPKKRKYKSEHITLDKHTGEHNLDKLSFTFVDLIKFDKKRTKPVHELILEEKFYYFLRHAPEMDDETLHTLIGKDIIIKKAFHELERFGWSEADIRRYEAENKRVRDNRATLLYAKDEGIEEGKEIGREEGFKEGEERGIKIGAKEEKIEIAYKMFMKGMDTKTIQELTGLSKQWISRIKNDIEKSKLPHNKD